VTVVIEAMKKYVILYNLSHSVYKNRDKRIRQATCFTCAYHAFVSIGTTQTIRSLRTKAARQLLFQIKNQIKHVTNCFCYFA